MNHKVIVLQEEEYDEEQRDKTLRDANEADALKRWIDKVADTRIDLQMKVSQVREKSVFLFLAANFGVARCVCVANDLNAVMTLVRRGYVDLNEQDKEGHSAVEHMIVRQCDFDDILKAVHLFSKCDGKVDISRVKTLALQNGCSNGQSIVARLEPKEEKSGGNYT